MSQPTATRDKISRLYWEFVKTYEKNSSGISFLKVHREQYPTSEVHHFRDYNFNLIAYRHNWRVSQPDFDYAPSSWSIDILGKSKSSKVYLDMSLEAFLEQWVGLQTTECFPGTPRATPFVNAYELVEADKHRLYFEITAPDSLETAWDAILAAFLSELESMMTRYVPGFTWRNNCDVYTLSSPLLCQGVMSFHIVCPFVYVTRSQNHHLALLLTPSNRFLNLRIYNDSQAIRLLGTSDRCNVPSQGLPQYDQHLRRKRLSYQCNYVAMVFATNASFKDVVSCEYYKGIFQGNPTRDGINLTELYTYNRELVKEICRFSLIGLCVVYPNSVDLTAVDFGEKKKAKYSRAAKHPVLASFVATPSPLPSTPLSFPIIPLPITPSPITPSPLPEIVFQPPSIPVNPTHEVFYRRYPTADSILKCPVYGSKIDMFLKYIHAAMCGQSNLALKLLLFSIANPFVNIHNPRFGKLFVLCGGPREEKDAFIGFLAQFRSCSYMDYNDVTRQDVLPTEIFGKTMVVLNNVYQRDTRKMKIRRSNLSRLIKCDTIEIRDMSGVARKCQNTLNLFVSEDLTRNFDFDVEDKDIVVLRSCYTQLNADGRIEISSVPFPREESTGSVHNILREFYSGSNAPVLASVFLTFVRRYHEENFRNLDYDRKIQFDVITDKKLLKRAIWKWSSALMIETPYKWLCDKLPITDSIKDNSYFCSTDVLYLEFRTWIVGKLNILHTKGIRKFADVLLTAHGHCPHHVRFYQYGSRGRYVTPNDKNCSDKQGRHTGFTFFCDHPLQKGP